jgi:conjugative relaxase-like TrwC/TraI family protein
MRFTVTPLGGAARSVRQVVADVVEYLVPQGDRRPTPGTEPSEPATGVGGPARYYADRGDEPGRWLGKGAPGMGLSGQVDGDAFAKLLAGRHPSTGARLITAQGSAGRRPKLGAGTETRWDQDGNALYDERDAAAALGVPRGELSRMLDAGTRLAVARLVATWTGTGQRRRLGTAPAASGMTDPATGTVVREPSGSYLVPVLDTDGNRWVTDAELTRCEDDRAMGIPAEEISAAGDPDDLLPLADAARIAGVTVQYLRRVAKHYEQNRATIEEQLAAGRRPRRAYLVAHRDARDSWLVKRGELAAFVARREPPAVRVGYDVTGTCEKSLSVLALLSEPRTGKQVLDAIQTANDWAMSWLERHAATARVDGKTVPVDGWTVASFRHLTSRASDPFAHHHNVLPNTVEDPTGTRRALDARGLYRHARAASALATAQLRWTLTTGLGVHWRPGRRGGWEIAGMPDELLTNFSQRRNEVDEALRELEDALGRGARPDEVESIVLRTRKAKQHVDLDDLRASWWRRARDIGFDQRDLLACTGRPRPATPPEPDALYDRLASPDGICRHVSVFNYGDVLAALCDMPVPQPDGADPQPLLVPAELLEQLADGFLASPHVVRLTRGKDQTEPLYTTREILAVQDRIVARYRSGIRDGRAVVARDVLDDALGRHPRLTSEQRTLVTAFCTSGQRIQCAVGRAGAGKTTAMRAASEAWQAAGFRVAGAAVKGEAARILGDVVGVHTETLAWWLAHDDPHTVPLDARTILVVDEASTVSDRDLDQLGWLAEQTGATLRLVGDPAQHSAVEAGGMFRVLCEQYKARTPELTHTLRIRNPRDRAAAEALRAGQVDEALDHLDLAGHLHIVEDELNFFRQVLSRWWEAHRAGLDHPMVDRRNVVRRRLNRLAHRLLQTNGEVGTDASGTTEALTAPYEDPAGRSWVAFSAVFVKIAALIHVLPGSARRPRTHHLRRRELTCR